MRSHIRFKPEDLNMRPAGRSANQVRPVTLTRNYTKHAEGSVLVEFEILKCCALPPLKRAFHVF